MSDSKHYNLVKAAVALTYLAMVAVNAMATALPINGITTGDVSDSFPNLFAPAGITFFNLGINLPAAGSLHLISVWPFPAG